MWNKTGHTVAFWDLFGWPRTPAKYGLNVLSDLVVRRGEGEEDGR